MIAQCAVYYRCLTKSLFSEEKKKHLPKRNYLLSSYRHDLLGILSINHLWASVCECVRYIFQLFLMEEKKYNMKVF